MVVFMLTLQLPSSKDALYQSLLKLTKWFLKRRFVNFVNVFSLYFYPLYREKGVDLHLNKLETRFPKVILCYMKVCWKLAQSFLSWEEENVKWQTNDHTDKRQSEWPFISIELEPMGLGTNSSQNKCKKAKMSVNHHLGSDK